MRKVISLFQRNYGGDRLVRDELVPGAEWVAAGEGVATVKWDGTACLWQGGRLWRRYDAKKGKQPPPEFVPAQDPDPITGHHPGWVPCKEGDPADRWHLAALQAPNGYAYAMVEGATYEAVGLHHQGNPYGFPADILIPHGKRELPDAPRDFEGLRAYLKSVTIPGPGGRPLPVEGIVWWHDDGRLVKIKAKDFGHPWPPRTAETR